MYSLYKVRALDSSKNLLRDFMTFITRIVLIFNLRPLIVYFNK